MKKLSLQWRITLMTTVLIGLTCIAMKLLLCSSGMLYMDLIGNFILDSEFTETKHAEYFDPLSASCSDAVTIVVANAQEEFCMSTWFITAAVALLSGILTWFVSGQALKPLKTFANQVETVQLHNLADVRIDENAVPEFHQLSHSFNQMLERLDNAFTAQKQFSGNAAHELRTPVASMQAQIELFTDEHPHLSKEYSEFLGALKEQNERLSQTIKTLLEMSNLEAVERNDFIEIGPMVEEIFADLTTQAERRKIALSLEGNGSITGSDTLLYRMLFNLTENAIKFNRESGTVTVAIAQDEQQLLMHVIDTGLGIPEEHKRNIFQPFFRVDGSRNRELGGVGLGMSLVWEIANLHNGDVWVEKSGRTGTTIAIRLPKK